MALTEKLGGLFRSDLLRLFCLSLCFAFTGFLPTFFFEVDPKFWTGA
jgi:hypothetical protein